MRVHASALKPGISPEDAVHAADWSQWIEPLEEDDWPHRELRLGFDTHARLLETVVLVFESGEEMVIHAFASVSEQRAASSETQILGPAALSAPTLAPVDGRPVGDPLSDEPYTHG